MPGMPSKDTSVTCRQVTAAGGCCIFDVKMTSRSLDYRAVETGKFLFEDLGAPILQADWHPTEQGHH